jgi:hypothetical protein
MKIYKASVGSVQYPGERVTFYVAASSFAEAVKKVKAHAKKTDVSGTKIIESVEFYCETV